MSTVGVTRLHGLGRGIGLDVDIGNPAVVQVHGCAVIPVRADARAGAALALALLATGGTVSLRHAGGTPGERPETGEGAASN
jgi:hypothetical protein